MNRDEMQYCDEVVSEYANVMADIIYGKNLLQHYISVCNRILEMSLKIDECNRNNIDPNTFKAIGYDFYCLLNNIRNQLDDLEVSKAK
jgi:hypothetical protein